MSARHVLFGLTAHAESVSSDQAIEAMAAFEAEIRKDAAATVRGMAPKYLDNDVDVHVWHVLDDLSNKIENPDKDNA